MSLSLTAQCRVDSFTPEHIQLYIAEEGVPRNLQKSPRKAPKSLENCSKRAQIGRIQEPFAELPVFESFQFWSMGFPGEPITLPPRAAPLVSHTCLHHTRPYKQEHAHIIAYIYMIYIHLQYIYFIFYKQYVDPPSESYFNMLEPFKPQRSSLKPLKSLAT